MLGWAFKKDTNDTRESAAIYVSDYLLSEQADVIVYDPKVKTEQIYADLEYLGNHESETIRQRVKIVKTAKEACQNAHAIAVMTEWDEFKSLDWKSIYDDMYKPAFVFDGRRILDQTSMEALGFNLNIIGN
jgi:UDPglucose 6-dehydrogenase